MKGFPRNWPCFTRTCSRPRLPCSKALWPYMRRIAAVREISPTISRCAGTTSVSCNRNLRLLGLSSLGRTESHVLTAVQTVHHVLNALLCDSDGSLPSPEEPALGMGEGIELLEANTDSLLGPAPPGRKVRIMVTMASDAATDYELVRDLVRNGMDCMRINCAHDNPKVWLGMIQNLQKARRRDRPPLPNPDGCRRPQAAHRRDRAGPSVIKCRPKRDVYGRVVDSRSHLAYSSGQSRAGSPLGHGVHSACRRLSQEAAARRQNPASRCPQSATHAADCQGCGQKLLGRVPRKRFTSCRVSKCA